MQKVLSRLDVEGKNVGQFCCNNGRELLSLVKSGKVASGIGFNIAENQVAFANQKAAELELPCRFIAVNIYDIGDEYNNLFDVVIITIGALCWFKDLKSYFEIVSKCMKTGSVIIINEQHPFENVLAATDEDVYDPTHPLDSKYSYFEHEWISSDGMSYITGKAYKSKTFTDYTHSLSEIISAMCSNSIAVTGMQEFDYDIGGNFEELDGQRFPLSMILEGRKNL